MGKFLSAFCGVELKMANSSMSEEQVNKQLDHMVSFILKEAQEKAAETLVKAREQFAREKAQKIRDERQRILQQFEKLQKEIDVREKIEKSNAINQSRLRLLKAREEVMAEAVAQAAAKLDSVGNPNDAKYKSMLQDLILQGLIKLEDDAVVVNCRKCDEKLVNEVLPAAAKQYTEKTGRKVKASLASTMYLPPGKSEAGKDKEFCSGGVVLASHNGRIVCDNTLDRRLELAYEGLLPQVRGLMFGYSTNRKFFN